MKISELISSLQAYKDKYGDIPCYWFGCGNYHLLGGEGYPGYHYVSKGTYLDENFETRKGDGIYFA